MIDCIFTLDYEIYGNGTGRLRELVYDPAERLRHIFNTWNARFVVFVEAVELERIEACSSDPAIHLVKQQVRDFYQEGFEIGLHLHPQWSNARYDQGRWLLDYNEYNLCTLPRLRITRIVERSLAYLRYLVDEADFKPLSFRAGNWLFQPTQPAASVLAEQGLRIDSSVFKGGLQRRHQMDYRPALGNGYYWPFDSDVNVPDPRGAWVEFPIHTEMVPSWQMATSKRLGFRNSSGAAGSRPSHKLQRALDLLRFRYPLKLDFCRMTMGELTSMMSTVIEADQAAPDSYKPIVAIGHTKDLIDVQTVDCFLSFLHAKGIPVTTFQAVQPPLFQERKQVVSAS